MSCKDTLYSGQGVRPVSSCVCAPKFDAVTSVRTSFLHFTWLICSTHQSNELGSRFSGVYIYYFVDHSSKTNKLITYLAMTYHSPYLSQSDTSLQQYLNNVLNHLQCWYCVQLLGYSLEYEVWSYNSCFVKCSADFSGGSSKLTNDNKQRKMQTPTTDWSRGSEWNVWRLLATLLASGCVLISADNETSKTR